MRGDADALGALCAGVAPVLLRRAASITRDHALAEDAVQETFLDLVRGAHAYDARRPLLPWLIGMTTRKALKARRSDRRRPDLARLPRVPGTMEFEPHEDGFRTLKRFAEPYRSAALLRWRYDLAPAEVARLRGEPAGTTRSLLSRAIAQLRRIASTLAALAAVGLGWRWVMSGLRRFAAGPERETAATVVSATGAVGGVKGFAALTLSGIVGIGSSALVAHAQATPRLADGSEHVAGTLPADWDVIHRHRPSVDPLDAQPALPG